MKKLILIQNDYSGAGKTTLSRCIKRYLNRHRATYQALALSDNETDAEDCHAWIDPSNLKVREIIGQLDLAPITIIEASSGMAEVFAKFFQAAELSNVLHEMGVEMTVAIPVTSEPDSHEAVTEAAETFSDNVQYLIAHTVTSAYEDDDHVWDRSYAARVMDMFEAVELHLPEIGFQLGHLLRAKHTDLPEALLQPDLLNTFGKDFDKWHNRVEGQIDSARQYLFGDDFKPIIMPVVKKRGRKKLAEY